MQVDGSCPRPAESEALEWDGKLCSKRPSGDSAVLPNGAYLSRLLLGFTEILGSVGLCSHQIWKKISAIFLYFKLEDNYLTIL